MELANASIRERLTISVDDDNPPAEYVLRLEYTGGLDELLDFANTSVYPIEISYKPNKLAFTIVGDKETVFKILREESRRKDS